MTRKRVNLGWIVSDSARRASFKKRRLGLVKKVSELSILCGVSASVIIDSPYEKEPTTWPAPPQVQQNLMKFHNMPEIERGKKMMDQETYLKEKVSKMEEQLKKQQMKNKKLQVSDLMHYVYQSNAFDALSVNDFHSLMWFAQEKRKEIKKRVEYCQQGPLSLSSLSFAPSSSAPPTPDQAPKPVLDQLAPNVEGNIDGSDYDHHVKTSTESIMWDQWFSDMMNNSDEIAGSSSKVKINHETGFNAPYQPFVPIPYSGNQSGLVDFGNFCGSSGGNQMQFIGAIDMPMLQPPQLPFYIEGCRDFTLGLQVDGGFTSVDKSSTGSDTSMALVPLSHFEGNGSGSDIAMGLQRFGDAATSGSTGNASGSDIGPPSEFLGSNITASDIGSPDDLTKECPTIFHP